MATALGAGIIAVPLLSRAQTPKPPGPRIVDVAARPAFTRAVGRPEVMAQPGQLLAPGTVLRTQSPGRLQVRMADGRSFRLGGDAELRLTGQELDLRRGQIIAWVNPGQKGQASPLRIRTRVATASIVGTTVFIEASPDKVLFLSWEGRVKVDTDTGKLVQLKGGQVMAKTGERWDLPRRLTPEEARSRRARNPLFSAFTTPMDTLPLIDRQIDGLSATPAAPR
ncbi:FecR family protein [Cyanobium sp. Morenito 9A2]|uniref:FecR family protein n=1 Tax=Cyanobium sp. Morenito 9A2 TaxID=2823718 RepID=UPI0020CC6608|nr:FecR family protein [Cyanobium sp. Morenito 9A2]MCP9850046.1 FecR domain-containing protein [Cyanobium sp. Morenito 9A2]